MHEIAQDKIEMIKRKIGQKDVYFVIDETPDCVNRNVINVIVGILDNSQIKPMLLNVHYPDVANSKAIEEIVLDNCKLLWPQDNRYPCLHLIISDQAQYMISAVRMMKLSRVVFPNIHHITCIVHAIDLVCKQISDDLAVLNDFMVEEKNFSLIGKEETPFHIENQAVTTSFTCYDSLGNLDQVCRLSHQELRNNQELFP